MILLQPVHARDLYEVNHCHGLGTKGHPCDGSEGTTAKRPVGMTPARTGRWGLPADNEYERGSLWYSFPETGGDFEAERVASYPLSGEVGDKIDKLYFHEGGPGLERYLQSLAPKTVPAGYTVIYRIGSESGGLAGRQGANARGLIEFIDQMTDGGDTTVKWGFQLAKGERYLSVYLVRLGSTDENYEGGFRKGWSR